MKDISKCEDAQDLSGCPLLLRLDRQVNGNGQPGIKQQVQEIHDWVTRQEASGAEREKLLAKRTAGVKDDLAVADKKRAHRVTALIVLLTFIAILLAIPPAVQALKDLMRADIHLPKIVVQAPDDPALARKQPTRDAQNPRMQ
jgi:hypothetical protein